MFGNIKPISKYSYSRKIIMIYWVILILILIGIYVYDIKRESKNKIVYYYFIFLLLSFLAGFSYRLGTDTISYMSEYQQYESSLSAIKFDTFFSIVDTDRMPLWKLVNIIFRIFHCEFWTFHLFHALIINSAVCYIFRKYTNCSYWALLLYFVIPFTYFNFEILRESLAIAIFLYSVPYLLNKHYIKYYIGIILAFGFHISASVLFLVPFAFIIPKNRFGVCLFLSLCMSILFFSQYFTQTLLLLLNVDLYAEKALGYFSSERYATSKLSVSFLFNIFFYIGLPYLLFIKFRKIQNNTSELFHLVALYTLIYAATLIVPIFYRINNYFVVFFLIYLSELANIGKLNKMLSINMSNFISRFLLLLFLYIKFSLYWEPIASTSYPSYLRYYPYASIFDKTTDIERERIFMGK